MLDAGYWMVVFDEVDYWNRMALGLVDFGLIELKTNRLRANRLGRIDA